MSFDKKDIERILKLDSDEFAKRISAALTASGKDAEAYGSLLRDSDKIKKALSSLSASDIEKLSAVLKNNNLESLEKILKDSGFKR